jgi:hypothetical protein
MSLPSGFKVNGSKASGGTMVMPPRAQKVIASLDALPFSELLSTRDLGVRVGFMITGVFPPALDDYHEKIDGKLLWGSKKSIRKLRSALLQGEQQ